MGFWSTLGGIAAALIEGAALSQTHPALQKAWDLYVAEGYELVSLDTYELTGRRQGTPSARTVALRVDTDGSVVIQTEGPLGVRSHVIPAGPLTPTIAEFEAARRQAARADHQPPPSDTSSSRGPVLDERSALELLGLRPGATRDEITAAFRSKTRAYHPDKYHDFPQEFRDLAHQKMVELNAARDLLVGR